MIILDTDHVTVLGSRQDARYDVLANRLEASVDPLFVTTAVTLEEQVRGWLAEINRWRDIYKQVAAYTRLVELFEFLRGWEIIAFDVRAAGQYE